MSRESKAESYITTTSRRRSYRKKKAYGMGMEGGNWQAIVDDKDLQKYPAKESRENGGSDIAADGVQGSGNARNQTQLYPDSSMLYNFRDMQRRQVEFVKKRVLLLEKGLNAEYQKEYFGDPKASEITDKELQSEPKSTTIPSYKSVDTDIQMIDQLPQVERIGVVGLSAAIGLPLSKQALRSGM